MSRQFWIIIIVLVIATAIYYPYSPAGRQSRNMKLAEQHIATLKPQFSADPRFANVQFTTFTGSGGSLQVYGEVDSQSDVDAAIALVRQSNPPCPVVFRLGVRASGLSPTRSGYQHPRSGD